MLLYKKQNACTGNTSANKNGFFSPFRVRQPYPADTLSQFQVANLDWCFSQFPIAYIVRSILLPASYCGLNRRIVVGDLLPAQNAGYDTT